jgi:hypothetical protein
MLKNKKQTSIKNSTFLKQAIPVKAWTGPEDSRRY